MNNTEKHNALLLLSEAAFQINVQQLLYPSSTTIPGGEYLIALGSPAKIVALASLNTIYGIQMGNFSHPVEGYPVCYVQ